MGLIAVIHEKTKGRGLDSGIFLIALSPLSLFLSYLMLGGKIVGGKKKNLQSSKDQVQVGDSERFRDLGEYKPLGSPIPVSWEGTLKRKEPG